MFPKLLLSGLFMMLCFGVKAQLQITGNGREINYVNSGVEYALTPNNNFSSAAFLNLPDNRWKDLISGKIPISHAPHCVWLKIPVNTLLHYADFKYIDINNPHVNFLQCWIVKNDTIIKTFKLSGDNKPFYTRPLPTATFVYPVNGSDYKGCDFILATDKRYTKLDLPINFYTEAYYIWHEQIKNLLLGLATGLAFFLFLFNFYLFTTIKQNLYLWYSLYILLVAFFLETDMGQLFKYFYPDYPFLNDIIRPAVFALAILPLVNFFNDLVEIPKRLPGLHLFNRWLLIIYTITLVLAILTSIYGSMVLQSRWVYANRVVYPLVLVILLAEAIYCYTKGIRYAGFAVVSFAGTTIFSVIYSLQQNEYIPRNGFTALSLYWGLFFEGMVLAVTLAWRFKVYKDDSERLYKENQLQQEMIFKETAAYQQKEMQRMSSLLHDTVGANLGFLRLETDNMPLTEDGRNKIAQGITNLGNEVRTMSHGFSPLVLQDKGLYQSIAEMAKVIISNTTIDLQLEWLGKREITSVQYELIIYRMVQEILQNMVKHSKAKTAFLQIMIEQSLVSIYAEDDGVGMNAGIASGGIGLKSMADLVKLLKGNYSIKSDEENGFSISIEFKQHGSENL